MCVQECVLCVGEHLVNHGWCVIFWEGVVGEGNGFSGRRVKSIGKKVLGKGVCVERWMGIWLCWGV